MEKWKSVVGYEGLYEVSSTGRVKSLKRIGVAKDRVIGGSLSNGYPQVVLVKNGKGVNFKVHRLVANAFIENPDNKRTVNHKDGVKHNNNVENLEWMTHQENSIHAVETGLADYSNRGTRALAIKCLTTGEEYESITVASEETGVFASHISQSTRHETYCTGKVGSETERVWVLLDDDIDESVRRKEEEKQRIINIESVINVSQDERDELRIRREEKQITQQDIADELGCNHSMISRFESGIRNLSIDLLEKYIEQVS